MSLSMSNHIDGVFQTDSVDIKAYLQGSYDNNGIWVPGQITSEAYTATVQPLSERELDNLMRAGERILDPRKIYINSGDFTKLLLSSDVEFSGQRWKIIRSDIRPSRRYAKIIVSRYDQQ